MAKLIGIKSIACKVQTDISLNAIGHDQALALQHIVKGLDIQQIYYSPLIRAEETMRIVCKDLQSARMPLDSLKAQHFGSSRLHIFDEIKRDTTNTFTIPEDGESNALYYERTVHALNTKLHETEGKVLFIAHSGTFRVLCKAAQTFYESVHNCQVFHFVAPDETNDQWRIYEL